MVSESRTCTRHQGVVLAVLMLAGLAFAAGQLIVQPAVPVPMNFQVPAGNDLTPYNPFAINPNAYRLMIPRALTDYDIDVIEPPTLADPLPIDEAESSSSSSSSASSSSSSVSSHSASSSSSSSSSSGSGSGSSGSGSLLGGSNSLSSGSKSSSSSSESSKKGESSESGKSGSSSSGSSSGSGSESSCKKPTKKKKKTCKDWCKMLKLKCGAVPENEPKSPCDKAKTCKRKCNKCGKF